MGNASSQWDKGFPFRSSGALLSGRLDKISW